MIEENIIDRIMESKFLGAITVENLIYQLDNK